MIKFKSLLNQNFNWLPPHYIDKYYLAIHSPKIIPEFKIGTTFIRIEPGTRSTIKYSKMKIERKYEYNCKDYEIGDDIRNDCLAVCVMKKLQNDIGDLRSLYHYFLLRKVYFSKLQKFNKSRHENHLGDSLIDIRYQCLEQCKEDCTFSHYLYDITIGESRSKFDKSLLINVQHNHIPDVYLHHIFEMTLITFISNFGGLLGMWFGISVLMIFDKLFNVSKIINNYISRRKPRKIFINRHYIYNNLNPIYNYIQYRPTNLYRIHKRY